MISIPKSIDGETLHGLEEGYAATVDTILAQETSSTMRVQSSYLSS